MKRILLTAAFATLTGVGAIGLYAVEALFKLGEDEQRAADLLARAGYDASGVRVRDGDNA